MKKLYSTAETCRILGVSQVTIYRHIRRRTFEPPAVIKIAGVRVRPWTDEDVARAKAVLKKFKV